MQTQNKLRVPDLVPDNEDEQRAIAKVLSDVDGRDQRIRRTHRQETCNQASHHAATAHRRMGAVAETKQLRETRQRLFSKGRGIKRDDVSDDFILPIYIYFRYGELYTVDDRPRLHFAR